MAGSVSGRVVHGGAVFFRDAASRIDAAVPAGDRPILTRGARHLRPPARYWFYNTEPLQVPHKRADWYCSVLDGAERVFDYSAPNLAWYPRAEFCPIQLGTIRPPSDLKACDIDILFYGHPTPRRLAVLDALPVRTVTVYGDALVPWVRRATITLAINAYDDVNGNPFRTFPALEWGGRLIVERCHEAWFTEVIQPHALIVAYPDLITTCQTVLEVAHGPG